ncbi:hypothetical protein BDB13_4598 [Rhodococcus sp. OK302]|nr:hypothetical protein BDB13_4598 [Rhodococcus sp. OK302]
MTVGGRPIIIRCSLFGLIGLIFIGLAIAAMIYGLAHFVYMQNPTMLAVLVD